MSLAQGINAKGKFPRFIIVSLDDDIINYAEFEGVGVSSLYGDYVEAIVNAVQDMIKTTKEELPDKFIRENYPLVYWVMPPLHKDFIDNDLRVKLNSCWVSVIKQIKNMHMLNLKEWSYDKDLMVDRNGFALTEAGTKNYWHAIDAAFKFNAEKFSGFGKKTQTLQKEETKNGKEKTSQYGSFAHRRCDEVRAFLHKNQRDKYKWSARKHNRFILPRPPAARR